MKPRALFAFMLVLVACGETPPAAPVAPVSPPATSAFAAAPTATPDPASSSSASTVPGPSSPDVAHTSAVAQLVATPIALPGASGAVSLDYIAVERAANRVWVPAGGTGSVDVIDVATKAVTRIEGFATVEREMRGKKRLMGPSSVSIGDGFAYVGNRATSEICAIDLVKRTRGACVKLDASPDGVVYVATTKEVWVTTPSKEQLVILDASSASKLVAKGTLAVGGEPEGYAVDVAGGIFYTNLENKDRTLAIDVRARKVRSTWDPKCGSQGPRGLAVDPARAQLFVACTDHVEVLDTAHDGAIIATFSTGGGVDNIDYLDTKRQLFVVSGATTTLFVLNVAANGALVTAASGTTAPGTRVVVAAPDGSAFVADPMLGRVLAFAPAP